MKTRICGIPCTVTDITVSGSYIPAKVNAEAEYPEVEFTVRDRRGRPAPWLVRKMKEADYARIEALILEGV